MVAAVPNRIKTSSISYGHSRTGEGQFWIELHRLMRGGAKRFCDVGGGARPVVSLSHIQEFGLDYLVLDESNDQLNNAPQGYHQFQANILDAAAIAKLVQQQGAFDVVLSRWTAEHIPDGRLFHEQIFTMLRPGGTAVHFFPTLYSLPFVLNRWLPPSLSAVILFRAHRTRRTKFRAYYSWCRGPSQRQIRRLRSVGFSVERYTGFFGNSFHGRIKPIQLADRVVTDMLLDHPISSMTSFALVVLNRPG